VCVNYVFVESQLCGEPQFHVIDLFISRRHTSRGIL